LFQVNNNTMHNWPALNDIGKGRRVQPIMYTDNVTSAKSDEQVRNNEAMVKSARNLGWTVLPVPRATPTGLPYLKDMYFESAKQFPNCTFYAYSNGDILFDRGIVTTLDAVAQVSFN